MNKERLIQLTTLDMLEGTNREIAEVIGIEAFCDLAYTFGGSNLYVPVLERLLIPARNQAILEEYPRLSFSQLARKYKVTESHIRLICSATKDTKLRGMKEIT